MKTRLVVAAAIITSIFVIYSAGAQTVVWTNTVSGGWNTAANWSPNTVPGSNNLAIINQPGVTVSLNGATSVGGIVLGTNTGSGSVLSLVNQSLTLDGPLTVNPSGSFTVDSGVLIGGSNAVLSGTINWTAGSLEGGLTLTNSAALQINGGTINMPGCNLTNNGTVTWVSGTIQCGSGTVIYNNGLWDMQSDQTINNAYGNAGTIFNNSGILRKSGGAGEFTATTTFASGVVFNQVAGEIDVQNGTNGLQLAFQGGGTFTGGYVTTNQFGLTVLSVGNFTVNGTVTGTNTWEDTGNLVGTNVLRGTLTWVGGNWNAANSVTVSSGSTLILAAGTGDLNMSGCQMTNNGTVAWVSGTIQCGAGTVIYNNGLWDMQSDQTINNAYGNAGTIFNNSGILRKSGGAGEFAATTTFASGVVFNQVAGEIDVQNGTNGLQLAFQGGGTLTGGYVTTNQFGLTVLSVGNFTVNGTVTGTNTWEDTGNLVGTNVLRGALTWVGGNWNSANSVTVSPGSTLILTGGTGDLNMSGCQTTNNGVITWVSGTIEGGNGTAIYNNGLWDMQSDQTFNDAYGAAGTAFYNNGTFRKSAGAGQFAGDSIFASGVVFNQQGGVIDVQNGAGTNGTQVSFQGGGNFTGGYITTNQYGLTTLTGGSFNINGTVTGSNTWENGGVLAGVNVIRGALTWQAGTWNGTVDTVAPATTLIISTASGSHTMDAVILTNLGTVNWSGDELYAGNGSVFYNYGLWNAQDDRIFDNYYGAAGAIFDNYGTFRKTGGATTNQTQFISSTFNQLAGLIDVQAGNLVLGGVENFTGGSTTSTGTIYFSSGSFTLNGTITSSNVVDNPGIMVGTNVINGALTWQGGSWNNAIATITSNSTLYINTASGTHTLDNCTITNNGTVNWKDDTLYAGNSSAFYNYGLWNAQDDHILENYYGAAGAFFYNYSTLRKSGGVSSNQTSFQSVNFNQLAGLMDVQTGNLVLSGTETLIGGSSTSTGTIVLSSGSFTLNGMITSSNVVDNPAAMTGSNVITGALTYQAGAWTSANVTVATNSVLYINTASGTHTLNNTTLINNGTVNWKDDTLYTGNGAFFYNYGLWNAQDDHILQNYYGGAGTLFTNLGTFRKTGTTGGSTQIQSGVIFGNAGTLDSQAGNISLQGAYSLTNGTLNFGLNGLTNYGTISLAGAAVLGGTVSANLNGGYQPIGGNSFTNLTYGSYTGGFTNAILPFADAWTTNYTPTAFYLHVLNARPTLATVPTQTVNELTLLTVTNTASDLDLPAQSLVYSLVSGPVGLAVNPGTGVITWTPAQTESPSTNTVVVSVTDNGTPALSVTNSFVIIVQEVNVAPQLPAVSGETVNVLATLIVTNTAAETNIHSITTGYHLASAPAGAIISSNGIITWTPLQAQGPSTNTFTTVVTNFNLYDLVNPTLTATNSFQVVVYAPTLSAIGNFNVAAGQFVSFTAAAFDNDPTRTLSYSLGTAPTGATINAATGAFNWRAPASYAGTTTTVQIEATANSVPSDTVTQSFQITVNPIVAVTLTALSKTAIQFQLQASGPIGPDYILQSTATLSPAFWTNIQTNTPSASPFVITTTNVSTADEYYRVKLSP